MKKLLILVVLMSTMLACGAMDTAVEDQVNIAVELTLMAKPTAVVIPTVKPQPTAMPAVVDDVDPIEYRLKQADYLLQMSDLMGEASDNFADGDGTQLLDPTWVRNQYRIFDEMLVVTHKIAYEPAPPEFQGYVVYMVLVDNEMKLATEDLHVGLDNVDIDALYRSIDHIDAVSEYLAMASDAMPQP